MTTLIVIGTRPEAIKLAPVVHAFRRRPHARVDLCVTSQHRELLQGMLDFFQLEPDFDLQVMSPGQTLADVTSKVLTGVTTILRREHYDRVVVQGDTTTAFSAGLASYYERVAVAHVEAGLRSGDLDHPFPEEANRRFVDLFARWLFAPTKTAADNLRAEGIPSHRIAVTGNTGIDALYWTRDTILRKRIASPLSIPDDVPLLLVTAHRRESFGEPLRGVFLALLDLLNNHPTLHVLLPLHPNPQVRAAAASVLDNAPQRLHWTEPLDYPRFVQAMMRADVILTDSGGVQEEAPALGKSVLVIRETTERPEGVEAGVAEIVGTDRGRIVERVTYWLEHPRRLRVPSPIYGDGRAADRIVGILLDDAAVRIDRRAA